MKQRLITSAIGIPILFVVLYAYPTVIFDIFLLAACLLGYYEAFQAYGQKHTLGLYLVIALATAVSFLGTSQRWPGFTEVQHRVFVQQVLFTAVLIAFILYVMKYFREIEISKICGTLILCAMLNFAFGTVLRLKALLAVETYGYLGAFLLILCLAYAWGGDTFAYFTGRAFGKKKLCPNISPNKTVAGALGAPVGSILFGLLFLWIYKLLMPVLQPDAILALPGWIWGAVALMAVPASLLGMCGDLYASCVKRQVGIKDYGTLLPGQGGILDRFDSVIPVMGFVSSCVCICALAAL